MRRVFKKVTKVDVIRAIVKLDSSYKQDPRALWSRTLRELILLYREIKKTTSSQPGGRSQGGKDD